MVLGYQPSLYDICYLYEYYIFLTLTKKCSRYFEFFDRVTRQNVVMTSANRHVMSRNLSGIWERSVLTLSFFHYTKRSMKAWCVNLKSDYGSEKIVSFAHSERWLSK